MKEGFHPFRGTAPFPSHTLHTNYRSPSNPRTVTHTQARTHARPPSNLARIEASEDRLGLTPPSQLFGWTDFKNFFTKVLVIEAHLPKTWGHEIHRRFIGELENRPISR